MIVYDILEADNLGKLIVLLNKNSNSKWKTLGTVIIDQEPHKAAFLETRYTPVYKMVMYYEKDHYSQQLPELIKK